MLKRLILVAIVSLTTLLGCRVAPHKQYVYRPPPSVDDGIAVGTPAQANMDEALLSAAADAILSGAHGQVHSLLVYKHDLLVFEAYFPGHDYQWDGPGFHGAWTQWDRSKRHNIHSVGKCITSACVGIAVEQGFIESVDQSIFAYLPDHQHLATGGREQITIEHLATMTSGLAWDELSASYSDQGNDVIALWFDCPDPIACILQKPIVDKPGARFNYSGGDMVLLGEIIKNASGLDIEAFAAQYLFAPLGIEAPDWSWINETGVVYAGGDQRLTPREMLIFGVAYLDGGVWAGKQVIPSAWVTSSARPYAGPGSQWHNSFIKSVPPGDSTWGQRGYGYTWWTHEYRHRGEKLPVYYGFGFGGQRIAVVPDERAVVVMTGGNYGTADATAQILRDYVLPAFE